ATLAGVSRSTVQRTLSAYVAGGLERIRQLPAKEGHSALDDHRASLEELLTQQPPRSVKQARHLIEQHTGIVRELTQVRLFLRRLGLKPRKVSAIPVPPKSTPQEHAKNQAEFLENKLEPLLEEARQGLRQVKFVDAAHFVYAPFLGVLWCVV